MNVCAGFKRLLLEAAMLCYTLASQQEYSFTKN